MTAALSHSGNPLATSCYQLPFLRGPPAIRLLRVKGSCREDAVGNFLQKLCYSKRKLGGKDIIQENTVAGYANTFHIVNKGLVSDIQTHWFVYQIQACQELWDLIFGRTCFANEAEFAVLLSYFQDVESGLNGRKKQS